MSATLTVLAILMAGAQSVSVIRTVCDTMLALLAVDLTVVMHSGCACGLCSVVVLSKEDCKLLWMKWADRDEEDGSQSLNGCRSCVVFAKSEMGEVKLGSANT